MNTYSTSPQLNRLLQIIEKDEIKRQNAIARQKLNSKGKYINIHGYKVFHDLVGNLKQSSALIFDLEILEKSMGKRNLNSI